MVLKGPAGLVPTPTSKVPIVAPYACTQNDSSASLAPKAKSTKGDTIDPVEFPQPVHSK